MVDLDELARLKAEIEVYKRHHAQCCTISAASRESVNQELLVLGATTPPGRIEPPSPSQHQERTYSTLKRPITSDTEAVGSTLATADNTSELRQDDFQIITFDPSSSSKTKQDSFDRRPRENKQKPTWKTAADSFVAEAPFAQDWNSRVQQLGIGMSTSTYNSVERLFQSTQEHAESTIIGRAKYHAQQAADFIAEASHLLANTRMYLLCVLSYFYVLDTMSLVEKDVIHDVMAMVVGGGSGRTDQFRKRIWDSAGWMNKTLMGGLVKAGWTWPQATTLCFFCTCLP
jgi:hypothetical protein